MANQYPSKSIQRRMEAQEEKPDWTPEPWGDEEEGHYGYMNAADGRRANACVNACVLPDGTPIPTEALKDGVLNKLIKAAQDITDELEEYDHNPHDLLIQLQSIFSALIGEEG